MAVPGQSADYPGERKLQPKSVGEFRWRPNNVVQSVSSADCTCLIVAEEQLLCKKISSRAKQ